MYKLGVLSAKQTIQQKHFTDFEIVIYDLEKVDIASLQGLVLPRNKRVQIEQVFQWLIRLQEYPLKPIWILTDKPLGEEKMIYLKLGVTGFLLESSPFEEIAWTIKNGLQCMSKEKEHVFFLDSSNLTAQINGKRIVLTKLEYMLLNYLNVFEHKICTYEEIADYLWKKKLTPNYRIANLIFHIRKKLEFVDDKNVDIIKTIRSKGYQLNLSKESIK